MICICSNIFSTFICTDSFLRPKICIKTPIAFISIRIILFTVVALWKHHLGKITKIETDLDDSFYILYTIDVGMIFDLSKFGICKCEISKIQIRVECWEELIKASFGNVKPTSVQTRNCHSHPSCRTFKRTVAIHSFCSLLKKVFWKTARFKPKPSASVLCLV